VIAPGIVTPVRWQTPVHARPLYAAVLSSTDGGNAWSLAANHLPDTGEYGWQVPYAPVPNQQIAVVLVEREISAYEVEGVVGVGPGFSVGNTTAVVPGTPAFALLGALPHPARGSFRIGVRLPDASRATLSLYDLAGRRMWSREVGTLGAGEHVVVAGQGAALRAGIYVIRLSRAGRDETQRAVLLP
jgi:hypothetical protein